MHSVVAVAVVADWMWSCVSAVAAVGLLKGRRDDAVAVVVTCLDVRLLWRDAVEGRCCIAAVVGMMRCVTDVVGAVVASRCVADVVAAVEALRCVADVAGVAGA